MYQQFNKYKILQEFFNQPNKKFQLREISRLTKISLPSVKKHIQDLVELDLIKENKEGLYIGYKSSLSTKYKLLKRNDILFLIHHIGLIREIEDKCTPDCVVLYGSAVEGTDDERGDVDIFIQSQKKNIDLKNYENKLKRKISLLFESDLKKIDDTLKNSFANGITLSGFLKVI